MINLCMFVFKNPASEKVGRKNTSNFWEKANGETYRCKFPHLLFLNTKH